MAAESMHHATPLIHALAGSFGSALAVLLFYPLERARIELQSHATSKPLALWSPPSRDILSDNELLHSVEVEVDLTSNSEFRSPILQQQQQQQQHHHNTSSEGPSAPTTTTTTTTILPPLAPSTPNQDSHDFTHDTEDSSRSWDMANSTTCTTDTPSPTAARSHLSSSHPSQDDTSHGLMRVLLNLYMQGKLYQGVTPVVSTIFTSQFVFFYMNEYVKHVLKRTRYFRNAASSASLTALLSLVASCVAGLGNVVLTNPLWVVNVAIVTGETQTSSLWKELLVMIHHRGLRHMWKGTSSSILLIANPVIQFVCYEQLKQSLLLHRNPLKPRSALAPTEAFVVGAMAKGFATVLTYPLQLSQTVLRLEEDGYKGTFDCLRQLLARGGLPEWFTGMRAKMLQTVLSAAFTFLTYEQIVRALQIALHRAKKQQQRAALR